MQPNPSEVSVREQGRFLVPKRTTQQLIGPARAGRLKRAFLQLKNTRPDLIETAVVAIEKIASVAVAKRLPDRKTRSHQAHASPY